MKNSELGRKYPILIVEYDPKWQELYLQEVAFLKNQFGKNIILRTEHFGSTAIPGLASKPSIDILVEIPSFEKAKSIIIPILENKGYVYFWRTDRSPGHMMFVKGYGPNGYIKGTQLYHLHMAPADHPIWERLLFRDYLREHPDIRKKYEKLKYKLAEEFRHDREAYTDGKEKFVKRIMKKARKTKESD
ncbi:MAG: GrpB family protein [Candidatus Hodarchaeota archaeon]